MSLCLTDHKTEVSWELQIDTSLPHASTNSNCPSVSGYAARISVLFKMFQCRCWPQPQWNLKFPRRIHITGPVGGFYRSTGCNNPCSGTPWTFSRYPVTTECPSKTKNHWRFCHFWQQRNSSRSQQKNLGTWQGFLTSLEEATAM